MFSRRVFSVLALALVPVACSGGTETGNPSFAGALSYTGYSSKSDVVVGDTGTAARVTVGRAFLSLGDVTLSRGRDCAPGTLEQARVPALGVGDHAIGAHNFTLFEATAGTYCSAQLPLTHVASAEQLGSAPPELEGHSILLAARLEDGTFVRILSAATPRLNLVPDRASFELGDGEPDLLMTFDFAAWLDDLDFEGATRVEGSIEVSERVNPELLAVFEANLPRGVALYRDRDGDGRLDQNPERLAHGE
jgi:hypothetical protein